MKKRFHGWLIRVHYRLMDDPQFWYKPLLKDVDRFVCVLASDINCGKFSLRGTLRALRKLDRAQVRILVAAAYVA